LSAIHRRAGIPRRRSPVNARFSNTSLAHADLQAQRKKLQDLIGDLQVKWASEAAADQTRTQKKPENEK